MSADDDLTVIMFMVLGTASAIAAAAGGFFGTRTQKCQGEFTPWSPCVGGCDETPTRSRKYVVTSEAPDCPYIDGYTETEVCGPVSPCCELVRDWKDPGDVPCDNGLKKFTRELRENKERACDGFETERYAPCCLITGQWQAVGACDNGQQRYARDYVGDCATSEIEKLEPCAPCVEGWDSYSSGLPSCPSNANDCGYDGDTFKRTWEILAQPIGTGTACTKEDGFEELVACPAQPPCCDYNPPATDGVCGSDGNLTYTRSYVNSSCKEDPSRNNSKSYTEPCCYEAGDWAPVEGCVNVDAGVDEDGNAVYIKRQKQKQTTVGCPVGTDERYVPCCGYTDWAPVGQCEPRELEDGITTTATVDLQDVVREIDNTIEGCGIEENPLTETSVPCCGYSAWEPFGQCEPREVISELEDGTTTTETVDLQDVIRYIGNTIDGCAREEIPFTSNNVPCCGYTDWTPSGGCVEEDGETFQNVVREIDDTNEWCSQEAIPFISKNAPCCGYSEWELGACTLSADESLQPSQTKIRDILLGTEGCYPEDTQTQVLQGTQACCFEEEWTSVDYCTYDESTGQYKQEYERNVLGTACNDTTNPETKYETCTNELSCPGTWDVYGDGFPDCPEEGVCTDQINYTRKWVKEQAPAGSVYTNCPSDDEEVCAAVPCDCVQGWDTSACPTEPGFLGNDPSKLKTWVVSRGATGTGTCTGLYEYGEKAPCDATAPKQVECEGTWSAWDTVCPTTETQCDYAGGEITQTRTWTTSTAPDGEQYINCPAANDTRKITCPATGACEIACEGSWDQYTDGLPSCPEQCGYVGETLTRNWTTNTAPPGQKYIGCPPASDTKKCPKVADCPPDGSDILAGGAAGAVGVAAAIAAFCKQYPTMCLPSETGDSIRDDVPVNCQGEFNKDVPACSTKCGQSKVEYKATYKHVIKQQGGGAHCPYKDNYVYTRTCEATPPCCEYETLPLITGDAACKGPPGSQQISLEPKKINEPCQEDGIPPTSEKVTCQNCYGFWEADVCPTGCGYAGGTVQKNWVTLLSQDANEYGEACPPPTTMTCAATPPCNWEQFGTCEA